MNIIIRVDIGFKIFIKLKDCLKKIILEEHQKTIQASEEGSVSLENM